jgi:hypothetical protein
MGLGLFNKVEHHISKGCNTVDCMNPMMNEKAHMLYWGVHCHAEWRQLEMDMNMRSSSQWLQAVLRGSE